MRVTVVCTALMAIVSGARAASMYQVGYGDTLWDLSLRFYGTPDYWDDILAANPQIPGPEYLVPGDEILLPDFAGAGGYSPYVTTVIEAPTLAASIPLLSRLRLETAGFVAAGPVAARGSVVGVNVEDRGIVSNDDAYVGDLIEIDLGGAEGASPGDLIQLLEPGEEVSDPQTGEIIGRIVRVTGLARITTVADETSIALMESSCQPTNVGDLFVDYVPMQSVSVNTEPALEQLEAWVVGQQEPAFDAYAFDTVYLNRGSEHGLRPGDVFVAYKYGSIASDMTGATLVTADIPISEVVILRTEAATCAALVCGNVTGDLVQVGDRLHLARRQSTQSRAR